MADTGLPRSEAARPPAADRRAALARFLAAASGAERCTITALVPLTGGAIQENWGVDAVFAGGMLAGEQRLVLRAAGDTGVPSSLDRMQEFAVLKAAFAAGVTVPEPLFAAADPAIFGKPFFVMRRAAGYAAAHRITRDPALEPALPAIAEELGRQLARIHRIRPPRPDLGFLSPPDTAGPEHHIAAFRRYLDQYAAPRPVLEWAMHWLETHRPAPAEAVLCHRDFRTGNYLVDGTQLTGILDWEFAGWSDPHEDIGWFCCRNWRFARLDREAGGIAARGSFYRGYEGESGRAIDPDRVRFWEAFASVRWAVIALQQCDRHRLHGERSLDLALTGRRAGECELALLLLLDPSGAPPEDRREPEPSPPAWDPLAADLPSPGDLLALARIVLIEELLPLLPAERHLDARLIANCLAIAARGSGPPAATEAILDDLRSLLETQVGADDRALLRRFACGLRIGAFENSPERSARARAILWRLTFARLRLANPRFLAANGFV